MTDSNETRAAHTQAGSVLDLTTALGAELRSHTPAGVTEMLAAELGQVAWMLVDSTMMARGDAATTLRMILDRASSQGVLIALDLNWQPQHWGLNPDSPPTAEVLRRFHLLAEAAALISAREKEAEWFLQTSDPVAIHSAFSQRPAVLVDHSDGTVHWCLGGRSGRLEAIDDGRAFLHRLIEGLCLHPELLGRSGPGADGVAQPDPLAGLLRHAAGSPPGETAAPADIRATSTMPVR
jgi:hypothetical protein